MSSTVPCSSVSGSDAAKQDLWKQAWNNLSAEDQSQYDDPTSGVLSILKSVQDATMSKKEQCVANGWTLYRNKHGEKVKLRHVLEKISVWVKEIIKVIDVGVSLDHSGHAALPWTIVKYLTTIGFANVDLFGNVAEGVESISRLIVRYIIVEKLYLGEDCGATAGLRESMRKLYAAILTYLARVKSYFAGSSWKRFGRSLVEAMRKQYDELWAEISEIEVEKWVKMVDAELLRKLTKSTTERYQTLKDTLLHFDKPIMQMSNQIVAIQDKFDKEERVRIFRWMSEIEYRSHHDDLSKGMLPQSGQWLLESRDFVEWGQSSVSSILWLHGIPGSGKTRLTRLKATHADARYRCRSAVVNIMLNANSASSISPIAFFYCARSTAEPERAKPVEIMGALLRQLASSKPDLPVKEPVAKEYEARKKKAEEDCSTLKKLTVEDCTRLILELTEDHPATIIIDALDECEESTRHELLEALDDIISNSAEVVKIFVSSRDDIDIKLHLENSTNISISAKNNGDDITRFVKSEVDRLIGKRLLLDGKVSAKAEDKIIETLTNGAQGMFRWVEMSLETLQRIKFKRDFMKALGELPSELSALYDIIYMQIDKTERYGRDLAIMTLKWLLCAQRLLTVPELVAAISMVFEDAAESSLSESEDESEGEQNPSPENDIIRLCHNLVVMDTEQGVFRFAHQSVREYLLHRQEYTNLEQHALAAERCLDVYQTESWPGPLTPRMVEQNNILKPYAMIYWPVHYKYVEDFEPDRLRRKISQFTREGSNTSLSYVQWASDISSQCKYSSGYEINMSLGVGRHSRLGYRLSLASFNPQRYLIAACAFGFPSLIRDRELYSTDWNQIQVLNGMNYTLLLIAAGEGQNKMVQILLDSGADVNPQGGLFGNALQAASAGGYNQVVQILLDSGADVNAQGGLFGNALQAASAEGYNLEVVQILLDSGADVDAQGGYYGNALQAASAEGHDQVVQSLLERGADVNAQGGHYGNALEAASAKGHDQVVQLLLERGADVNAQGGHYSNALEAASAEGHDQVAQMLLVKGALVNAQGVYYGNALEAASAKGHNQVVQLLLDRGADVNAQGGRYDNALEAASAKGHDQVVQMLLDRGADVNAQGGRYNNALEAASAKGYDQVVQLLLDGGADVNAQGELYGNALEAASAEGHDQVAQMLLDGGADVNAQGELYGNALQAASARGHDQVVQMLLDRGADVNAQGGRYNNALEAASAKGHDQVVQLLLDGGADVNAQGRCYGNALEAASAEGHDQVAQMLLAKGAHVKA